MWFLPMLFWCFIMVWIFEQIKVSDGFKIAILVCLNLFFVVSLPLRLSMTATYLIYFYGGYVIYKHSAVIKSSLTSKHIIWCWVVFIFLFVVFRPLKETLIIGNGENILSKALTISGKHACQLIYGSVGTISFYITAVWYTQRKQLKIFTLKLASLCFGIYLFHQFVLQLLYYHTSLSPVVGPYWLPWIGFAFAFIVSLLLSVFSSNTKLGRILLG